MPTDIRERLKALVEDWKFKAADWQKNGEASEIYEGRAFEDCADQLAAILAESEPGCEVCAERRRVAEESAQFLRDVEEGKRILAESESKPCWSPMEVLRKSLPLGHPFEECAAGANMWSGFSCQASKRGEPCMKSVDNPPTRYEQCCHYPGCSKFRSAHEPKDVLQMTHYKGDNCPGGHKAECIRCGKPCVEAGIDNLQVCDRCLDV